MTMTGKERGELRSECNRLKPTVHIGQEGISGTLLTALDDALRTRELVKIAMNQNAEVKPKAAANDLAKRVKAEVIQVIGRTATLYRLNPALKRKKGDTPPWRV